MHKYNYVPSLYVSLVVSVCLCVTVCTVLGEKAGRLAYQSQAYKKEAHYLNLRSSWAARIAVAVAIFLLLIFLRYWLF